MTAVVDVVYGFSRCTPASLQARQTVAAQVQAYISPEVDKAKCKAQGGSVSQGAIYRVQVSQHAGAMPCHKVLVAMLSAVVLP